MRFKYRSKGVGDINSTAQFGENMKVLVFGGNGGMGSLAVETA